MRKLQRDISIFANRLELFKIQHGKNIKPKVERMLCKKMSLGSFRLMWTARYLSVATYTEIQTAMKVLSSKSPLLSARIKNGKFPYNFSYIMLSQIQFQSAQGPVQFGYIDSSNIDDFCCQRWSREAPRYSIGVTWFNGEKQYSNGKQLPRRATALTVPTPFDSGSRGR